MGTDNFNKVLTRSKKTLKVVFRCVLTIKKGGGGKSNSICCCTLLLSLGANVIRDDW